jgi:hypothetical protein
MSAITKLADRLAETALDDEIVVMRIDTGEFFALSGTAAAIWRLIDGHRDRSELEAAVASEFAVDAGQTNTDVKEFLVELKEAGLIAES